MPQAEKIQKVKELSEHLTDAKGVFLTDFTGLSVEEITELRREFVKANVTYLVVKNTLARRSCSEVGLETMLPYLIGPTALAIAKEDPVAPVRIIYDFVKVHKEKAKPEIKGAILEGEVLSPEETEEIRKIPPREVLLAQVCGGIAAPLTSFAGGLNAILSQLVYAVNAVKEKKEE